MLFHTLLAHLPIIQIIGSTTHNVTGLVYDSRQVQPGNVFVAIKGFHVDGHAYIHQAVQRGATAVVVDARYWTDATCPPVAGGHPYTLVVVPNSRVALAALAAAFYGYPAQRLGVVGVTGTKGKSTTTALISQVLEGGGYRTGMITTVDFKVGERQWINTTRQSTPEAPEVQALLREMVDAGCVYAVLEATSHALSERWNRLGFCAFDVAVFLNVTHEHLDYHGSLEQYRRDKTRLFTMLKSEAVDSAGPVVPAKTQKVAIVNADDPHHNMFLAAAPTSARSLTYALDAPADIRGRVVALSAVDSQVHVTTPWGTGMLHLPLPGVFNVLNALAALSVALTQSVPLEQALATLGQAQSIRGRMERIEQGQPFGVIVDYAHNPDSFEQVLRMLRPLTSGKLIAVFGSAGERDREKRPLQGAIAARYCDLLILTDEDPRQEDRQAIINEIAVGVEQGGKVAGSGYLSVPDRAEAIRVAFGRAQAGDLVVLLGKGHEGSIEYAEYTLAWDEAAQARLALQELGYTVTHG